MKTLLSIFIFFFSISTSAQKKWSLQDCIDHAKENNIDVLKQKLYNKTTDIDVTIAKGNYYPDANFNASQGFTLGNSFNVSTGVGQQKSSFNSFSLSSSLDVFNGFRNRFKLQRAKLKKNKSEVDLDVIEFDLSLNITNKYLSSLYNKEIFILAKKQEMISHQEVKRIKKLYQAALRSKKDLLEIESAYANDKKETIIAENNLKTSLIELKDLLDIKSIENFDIQEVNIEDFAYNSFNIDPSNIITKAHNNNPLFKSTLIDLGIKKKDIQIAKSEYYPRLSFNYSYSSSYYHILGREDLVFNQETDQFEKNGFFTQLNNNRTHYIGFSLTIPIFNKFLTKSNVTKSKIELDITQIEFENQEKELKNKIEIAYSNFLASKASLEALESAFSFQQEAFKISKKKYQKGYIKSSEFLESKSRFIKVQSDYINSKYTYIFNMKILEYYQN